VYANETNNKNVHVCSTNLEDPVIRESIVSVPSSLWGHFTYRRTTHLWRSGTRSMATAKTKRNTVRHTNFFRQLVTAPRFIAIAAPFNERAVCQVISTGCLSENAKSLCRVTATVVLNRKMVMWRGKILFKQHANWDFYWDCIMLACCFVYDVLSTTSCRQHSLYATDCIASSLK
jgi:hypothetical protein